MKSGKKHQQSEDFLALPIPWGELDQFLQKDNMKKYARKIDMSTLIIVAKKSNLEAIIESALKSLKNTDPENATYKRAEQLANRMQEFAREIVKKTNGPKKE